MLKKTLKMLLIIFSFVISSYLLHRAAHNEVLWTIIKYIYEDTLIEYESYDLLLGSSTIKRLNAKRYLNCGTWLNRGIGNSTTSNVIDYIEFTSLMIKPSRILIYSGENDISKGMGVNEVTKIYRKLITILIAKYPDAEIHSFGIKLSPKRREHWEAFSIFNNEIDSFSSSVNNMYYHSHELSVLGYKDVYFIEDGIHLSNQGYDAFIKGFNEKCKAT